jgi:hypothetical protein
MANPVVEINQEQLAEAIEKFKFYGGNLDKALTIAINKSATRMKTRIAKAITEAVKLKPTYVKERLTVTRARPSNMDARIKTPKRGILVSRYSTDSNINNPDKVTWLKPPPIPKRGIVVNIDGTPKKFRGDTGQTPFYMVFPNRVLGIVARTSKERDAPIKAFYGASMSQVFNTLLETQRGKNLVEEASEIYTKQAIDAMRYLVTKMDLPKEDL